MGARKKAAKKRSTKKRSRKKAKSQGSKDAAWKVAERKVARYFGTERAPRGQKGSDTREIPAVQEWLKLRAPKLYRTVEPWSHLSIEVKCRLEVLPILERWHNFTLTNPEPKGLKPFQLTGPLHPVRDNKNRPWMIGMCLLEDFPEVYRVFLASTNTLSMNALAITSMFWINRDVRKVSKTMEGYFEQAEQAGEDWAKTKQTIVGPLPLVYLYYPKRVRGALCFKLPTHFGRLFK